MSRLLTRRSRVRALAAPVLATALAAGVLAGCSGSGDDGNTVTMWTYPVIFDEAKNKAYWDGLVKAFEKKHDGVKVKVETFPGPTATPPWPPRSPPARAPTRST